MPGQPARQRRRLIVTLSLILITAAGCSSVASSFLPEPEIESRQAQSAAVQPTLPAINPTFTRPTAPAASATPTPTATPLPTATPGPRLQQLTQEGCCVQPFFSPDSQRLLFIDKPAPGAPAGIYGVELANPQAGPTLIDDTIGFRSPDRSIVATLDGRMARFVDESTGETWTVDTNGNWIQFSPNAEMILWEARDREGAFDRRQTDIWLSDLKGLNPRLLLSVIGGGFAGWLPDGERILLTTRDTTVEQKQTLSVYDLTSGHLTDLAQEKRMRGVLISPGGSWVAYYVTFADDPERNGLWVVDPAGTVQQKLAVPGFGAYQWQDDQTLLLIPMRDSPDQSMQLWRFEVTTNTGRPLTDPNQMPFSVSNGDWIVSPDGRYVAFVNSIDQNIWLITLP